MNIINRILRPFFLNSTTKIGFISFIFIGLFGCATAPHRHPWDRVPPPEEIPRCESFISPLPGCCVISNFGQRNHRFHAGIDLKKSPKGGDSVLAARSGTVEMAQRFSGYGRMILLYHSDGSRTRYAHLKQIKVSVGQSVNVGDEIGTVGSSGRATTPHLHYEVLTQAKRPVNPRPYLH